MSRAAYQERGRINRPPRPGGGSPPLSSSDEPGGGGSSGRATNAPHRETDRRLCIEIAGPSTGSGSALKACQVRWNGCAAEQSGSAPRQSREGTDISQRPAPAQTGLVYPAPSPKKRRRCYFSPGDDQKLQACKSREELLEAIAAIVQESRYSRRSVVHHAKDLGAWYRFEKPRPEHPPIVRLLNSSVAQQDPLTAVAAKLCITKSAARKRIYRDDDCLESLIGGTYSAREVAEGFCMRRSTVSGLLRSGVLRAKKLQRTGKWRISSEAIVEFALAYPRQIPWSRCLEKSSWLRDVLEGVRYQQLAALLCVSPKTLRSWMERQILHLQFDPHNISELFSDEPVHRLLDEFPDLVNMPKCMAANPEWFARHEALQGRYPKRLLPPDRPKISDSVASASFRILLRR